MATKKAKVKDEMQSSAPVLVPPPCVEVFMPPTPSPESFVEVGAPAAKSAGKKKGPAK